MATEAWDPEVEKLRNEVSRLALENTDLKRQRDGWRESYHQNRRWYLLALKVARLTRCAVDGCRWSASEWHGRPLCGHHARSDTIAKRNRAREANRGD
jgi:hypothetical protein